MAILNRCCWFHNLDDGSIAVALFYMGVDIVGIAFFGVVLGLTEEVVEAFTAQGYEALQAEEMKKNAIIWLSILPVHLGLTILMFNGLNQRKRWQLLPWIIMDIPRLCYSAVQVVINVITVTDPPMVTICLNGLMFVGLQGYFNLCQISQYQVLKKEDKDRRNKYLSKYYEIQQEAMNDCAL